MHFLCAKFEGIWFLYKIYKQMFKHYYCEKLSDLVVLVDGHYIKISLKTVFTRYSRILSLSVPSFKLFHAIVNPLKQFIFFIFFMKNCLTWWNSLKVIPSRYHSKFYTQVSLGYKLYLCQYIGYLIKKQKFGNQLFKLCFL